MSPVTHFFASWLVANGAARERRDMAAVTIAGVIPDIDGLGAVVEIATRDSDSPLLWFWKYHHVLAHNLGLGLLVTAAGLAVAARRWRAAAHAFAAVHLHHLMDLVGARGPDGEQWPIPYLLPFSDAWQLSWDGQWALNAWPNFLVTGVLVALTFYLAWRRGCSPLGLVSPRADRAFVGTLRRRFPPKGPGDGT